MKNKTKIALFTLPSLSCAGALSFALVACGGDSQTAQPPTMPSSTPPPVAATTPPAATTADTPTTPPPKPPLADLEKATILSMVASFNAHDVKKLSALYTADAVIAEPAPEGWKKSDRDTFEKMHAKLWTNVPDATMGLVRVMMKGDQAALEWVANGTDTGGDKPTGKKAGFRAASVLWFDENGLIKQDHTYIDMGTIGIQLGKVPGKARALAALPTGDAQWLMATAADDALADKAKGMWPASWPKHDRKAYDASITDDFLHEEIASPMDYAGRKEALKEFDLYAKSVPDQTVTVENAWAAGGVVVMEFTFGGTQKGPLGPLKATGKKFTIHGLDVDTMSGDKMSKATTYSNSIEYLTQLGVIPPKDAAAPKDAPKDPKDKPKSK